MSCLKMLLTGSLTGVWALPAVKRRECRCGEDSLNPPELAGEKNRTRLLSPPAPFLCVLGTQAREAHIHAPV